MGNELVYESDKDFILQYERRAICQIVLIRC